MIHIGLIGCGRMGRAHVAAAPQAVDARIVAVCDPAPAGIDIGLPLVTLDAMLASDAIDAVLVAAPTPAHRDIVERALRAGKHVLCEKPLTLAAADDDALAARARAHSLILQTGFWRRFAEPYRHLAKVLRSGRIGAVVALRASQWDAVPPPPEFCNPEVSGGIEIDCGVHEFDMARWLFGTEIAEVTALAAPPSAAIAPTGDVDTVFGLARMVGGGLLSVDLTRCGGYRDSIRTEAIGTRGSAVVAFDIDGTLTVRADGACETIAFSGNVIGMALAAQLDGFAGAIRSGRLGADTPGAKESRCALHAASALKKARLCDGWIVPGAPPDARC